MLNLQDLQKLLIQNSKLQKMESLRLGGARAKRMIELQLHRTLLKDCIIELLETTTRAA